MIHNRHVTVKSIHPGEILSEVIPKTSWHFANALARALAITPKTVSEIVLGKRGISPETSMRLGKFFGQSLRFWMNLQTEYDFRRAAKRETVITRDVALLKELVGAR